MTTSTDAAASDKRIAIGAELFSRLTMTVDAIKAKGRHYKLNETKLAAAMLELFLEKYLQKDRALIESRFFDKRLYLKSLIEGAESDESLSASISSFLHAGASTKRSRKPPVE